MSSKTENVIVMDCNTVANGIMHDINDIDKMERMLSSELSSADLFRIDSAILASLKNTTDFSREMLHELETGKFEAVAVKPPKSFEQSMADIQQNVMIDITKPLQDMFNQMGDYVTEAFI